MYPNVFWRPRVVTFLLNKYERLIFVPGQGQSCICVVWSNKPHCLTITSTMTSDPVTSAYQNSLYTTLQFCRHFKDVIHHSYNITWRNRDLFCYQYWYFSPPEYMETYNNCEAYAVMNNICNITSKNIWHRIISCLMAHSILLCIV